MHPRYVLSALVLGGALIAFPAAAGDQSQQQARDQSSTFSADTWTHHNTSHQRSDANGGAWTHHVRLSSDNQSSKDNTIFWTQRAPHRDRNVTRTAATGDLRLQHRDWTAAQRRDWLRTHNHSGQWSGNWNRGTRHTVNRALFRFSSHDYRHFNRWEQSRWRHGHWHHGYHHGRYGWWWYLNGGWFFYANPIYPYPLYLSDDAYYDDYYYDGGGDNYNDDYDDYSGQPASDGYWYYCRDPRGYYPDVRTCRSDWQRVDPRDRDQDRGGYDNDDRDNGRYDNRPGDDRHYDDNGPGDRDGDDNGPDDNDDNGPDDQHN